MLKKIYNGSVVQTTVAGYEAVEGGVLTTFQCIPSGTGATTNMLVQVKRVSGSDINFDCSTWIKVVGKFIGTLTY